MTLEEIFKEKPELLNEPCVQNLIEYVKAQHNHNVGIFNKLNGFHAKVLDLCLYSDVMVIKGRPSKDVVEDILTLIENE